MKRWLSLFLTTVLVIGLLLSGCDKKPPIDEGEDAEPGKETEGETSGSTNQEPEQEDEEGPDNFNAEGFPIVDEKITLSMMGFKNPIQGPWEQLKFFNKMEEMTNIAFTYDTPAADAYEEKKNLAFASGEVPDIFFGGMLTPQQEVKYGSEGTLIPLEDLIEKYAPNIQNVFEQMPDVKKSLIAPDGHIYSLPNINKASIAVTGTIWVNHKWLSALGVSELPDNTDDLYALLKKMKDEDPNGNGKPDEIPFGIHQKGNEFNQFLLPAFGILGNGIYADNDEVLYGYMQPNYKEYISYVNKLWSEKLIDPDAFSQGYPELAAKGKAEQVGMASHAIPQLIYDAEKPEDAAKYPVLPALSSNVSSERMAAIGTGINRGSFAITSKCENPEAMIRWVDWLFSEEGSLYVHYGDEGDLWEYAENGLMRYILPEDGRNTEEYRGGEITPDCGTPLPKWVRDETEGNWDDVFQQYRIKETDEKMFKYGQVVFPLTYNTEEEQKRLDTLMTDISKYTETMEAKFFTGEASLEEYDKFVETLKEMGIEEVISINQAAYDRWNSSN